MWWIVVLKKDSVYGVENAAKAFWRLDISEIEQTHACITNGTKSLG